MEMFSLPEYSESSGKWVITVLDFARLQSELLIEFNTRREAWTFYNNAIRNSIESMHSGSKHKEASGD